MPDRRPSLNERRLQEYIDGLIKSGGKLPKSPHRGSWRTHTVYLKAITAATKIPTPALCVDPLKALLEKAENQIGFVEDEVDMLAMAGKWVYLPDAARAFGCYQSKLVAIVNKGVRDKAVFAFTPHQDSGLEPSGVHGKGNTIPAVEAMGLLQGMDPAGSGCSQWRMV